jgi:hypothetical protein
LDKTKLEKGDPGRPFVRRGTREASVESPSEDEGAQGLERMDMSDDDED